MRHFSMKTKLAAVLFLFVAGTVFAADVSDTGGLGQARSYKSAVVSVASSGDNTIVALVASKKIKVYAISINFAGTVTAKWKDGASTDLTGAQSFQTREGYTISVTPPSYLFTTSAGNALILNLSDAIGARGWISYWDDDGA